MSEPMATLKHKQMKTKKPQEKENMMSNYNK